MDYLILYILDSKGWIDWYCCSNTPVLSLISINFLIPKIPKTDLGSPQIVESDGTLEIAKTSNVPHFYTYFINQKFLVQL